MAHSVRGAVRKQPVEAHSWGSKAATVKISLTLHQITTSILGAQFPKKKVEDSLTSTGPLTKEHDAARPVANLKPHVPACDLVLKSDSPHRNSKG